MNPRIKELADTVFTFINDMASEGVADRYTFNQAWFQLYSKYFAELIIRDCIDKIETYRIPVGNSSSGELACEWTYSALKEIRDDIKEYFGIES